MAFNYIIPIRLEISRAGKQRVLERIVRGESVKVLGGTKNRGRLVHELQAYGYSPYLRLVHHKPLYEGSWAGRRLKSLAHIDCVFDLTAHKAYSNKTTKMTSPWKKRKLSL